MNDKCKFIVDDITDLIVIGGLGNDKGNLGLLKYDEKQIEEIILRNNNQQDTIRLVNSLLETLKKSEQKRLKAIEYINKYSNKGYNFGWVLQNEEIDKLLDILGENE